MQKYSFFEKCGTYHETLNLIWDAANSISMTMHSSCMGKDTVEMTLTGKAVAIGDSYWLLAFNKVEMNGKEVFSSPDLVYEDIQANKALVIDFVATTRSNTDWQNQWFWLDYYVAGGIKVNTLFDATLSFNQHVLQPKGEFADFIRDRIRCLKVERVE